jgi:hypothetical protein
MQALPRILVVLWYLWAACSRSWLRVALAATRPVQAQALQQWYTQSLVPAKPSQLTAVVLLLLVLILVPCVCSL